MSQTRQRHRFTASVPHAHSTHGANHEECINDNFVGASPTVLRQRVRDVHSRDIRMSGSFTGALTLDVPDSHMPTRLDVGANLKSNLPFNFALSLQPPRLCTFKFRDRHLESIHERLATSSGLITQRHSSPTIWQSRYTPCRPSGSTCA